MENLKITIDQLKNYLGARLKITLEGDEHEHDFVGLDLNSDGVHLISPFGDFGRASLDKVRLICYRLSDLDKFIPELGFVPIEEIKIELMLSWCVAYDEFIEITFPFKDLSQAPFEIFQHFVKWHFWPFGEEYFEQGLVIDKLKLQCTQ